MPYSIYSTFTLAGAYARAVKAARDSDAHNQKHDPEKPDPANPEDTPSVWARFVELLHLRRRSAQAKQSRMR